MKPKGNDLKRIQDNLDSNDFMDGVGCIISMKLFGVADLSGANDKVKIEFTISDNELTQPIVCMIHNSTALEDICQDFHDTVILMNDSIKNKDGRRIFARVVVTEQDGQYHAKLTGSQGSGILSSMALANGLAVVPEDKAQVAAGEKLEVMMLDWSWEL